LAFTIAMIVDTICFRKAAFIFIVEHFNEEHTLAVW
jgi:hypothetical protein